MRIALLLWKCSIQLEVTRQASLSAPKQHSNFDVISHISNKKCSMPAGRVLNTPECSIRSVNWNRCPRWDAVNINDSTTIDHLIFKRGKFLIASFRRGAKKYDKLNRLTSGELLSNDRGSVSFVSIEPQYREATFSLIEGAWGVHMGGYGGATVGWGQETGVGNGVRAVLAARAPYGLTDVQEWGLGELRGGPDLRGGGWV